MITAIATDSITVEPYDRAELTTTAADFTDNGTVELFVYGSEFKDTGMDKSLEAGFEQENNPIIPIKDTYEVSGSEMAHIGWVEVATENGASGYLW